MLRARGVLVATGLVGRQFLAVTGDGLVAQGAALHVGQHGIQIACQLIGGLQHVFEGEGRVAAQGQLHEERHTRGGETAPSGTD